MAPFVRKTDEVETSLLKGYPNTRKENMGFLNSFFEIRGGWAGLVVLMTAPECSRPPHGKIVINRGECIDPFWPKLNRLPCAQVAPALPTVCPQPLRGIQRLYGS